VLITQDLDFSSLLALGGYEKPSVINLRFENAKPDFITNRIIDIVKEFEKELNEGIVVSVDETSARYRNLPIATR
jgi:predicted nuclease of predicted toxin-antitoxin system